MFLLLLFYHFLLLLLLLSIYYGRFLSEIKPDWLKLLTHALLSVLWQSWIGIRKSIWPPKMP